MTNFLKEADSNQGDVINLLADKIIENARKNKFNIGNGNSDINAVKNFLKLIPKDVSDDTEAVKKIIFSASLNNIKLPEVKEKTQLEAVVEYIAKTAKSNGYSFKTKTVDAVAERRNHSFRYYKKQVQRLE